MKILYKKTAIPFRSGSFFMPKNKGLLSFVFVFLADVK
jgi:hypothetical protein